MTPRSRSGGLDGRLGPRAGDCTGALGAEMPSGCLVDGLEREERLAASIDAVRERFGENAITRARLLTDRPRRRFDFGERPNKAGPAREADEVDK